VAANVLLALVLMWPLRHEGLALASSLSSYVNLLGLCWILRRRQGLLGAPGLGASLARTLGASAVLLVWCVVVERWLVGARAGTVLVAVASGVPVYAAAAAALRAPELGVLWSMLRRRAPRLPSRESGC
jgi:putative peptidoglycan lipid II flippase